MLEKILVCFKKTYGAYNKNRRQNTRKKFNWGRMLPGGYRKTHNEEFKISKSKNRERLLSTECLEDALIHCSAVWWEYYFEKLLQED